MKRRCKKITRGKNKAFPYILLLMVFATFSCSDDNDSAYDDGSLLGKWEAVEFMSVESVMYAKDNDYNPVIEFMADGTFGLQLDINRCGGDYELGRDSTITMGNAGCTEACCDSQFSQKFVEMLPRVESYDIEDATLRLIVSGWGWINLERLSD